MTEHVVKPQRNQAMELFKLIASILVVFIHVKFPGTVGSAVVSLSRLGVPMFFAISGYFSYRVDSSRLIKRLVHIIILMIAAVAAAAVLGSITAVYNGESVKWFLWGFVPGLEGISTMMLTQESSFPDTGYTWYLMSMMVAYLVLYVYTRFFGEDPVRYQPLYIFSACLLTAHLMMGEVSKAVDVTVPYTLYRNGLFFGLPMVTLGIFLREHRERIVKNFALTDGKLAATFLIGVAMTLVQWKGTGVGELPLGAVVQTVALMLLLTAHPDLKFPAAAWMGKISTVVYLAHYPLIGVYETFVLPVLPVAPEAEAWLRPVLVAAISMLVGVIWLAVEKAVQRSGKKNSV